VKLARHISGGLARHVSGGLARRSSGGLARLLFGRPDLILPLTASYAHARR